jgi:protein SCO1/2
MIQLIRNSSLLLLSVYLLSCQQSVKLDTLPFFNKPDFTPEWISATDSGYLHIHTIPAFAFTDQDGNRITQKTVSNKIYVANFMFTSCGSICPKMTDNLKMIQTKYFDDPSILILSHSVTPERDSVPVLKKYAITKGIISGKWHLLTGDVTAIYAIAKKDYYAGNVIGYYGAQNDFLHTENCILIDKERRIRGVYNGTLILEMERLIADIETLKKE